MTTEEHGRNRELIDAYFRRQNAMDLDAWLELLDPDVSVLIPFAPDAFPQAVEGRSNVEAIYRDLFDGYSALRVDVQEVQLGLDPTFAVVRWHTHADLTRGGAYDNDLIGTFRFADGRITEVAEYFNPVRFLTAIGEPGAS